MSLVAFRFFRVFLCHFYACRGRFCGVDQCCSEARSKYWGGQNFEGAGLFSFRLTTVFCMGYRLSKQTMTRYSKNLRVTLAPLAPGCTCGPVIVLLIINFFDNLQVAFSRLDKFENNFWIVVKGASAPETPQWALVMVRMRFGPNVDG